MDVAGVQQRGPAILELDQVVATRGTDAGTRFRGSLKAAPGDLILLGAGQIEQSAVWADVATGQISPSAGTVTFLGNDWAALDTEATNLLRSRLGRVYSHGNWLDHLSVAENLLLPASHHTDLSLDSLREEAAALARDFGLPGLPTDMPDTLSSADLNRAACVRAFLGDPLLVLLEEPTGDSTFDQFNAVIGATRTARNRGAAVIWFTANQAIWRNPTLPASARYWSANHELTEVYRST